MHLGALPSLPLSKCDSKEKILEEGWFKDIIVENDTKLVLLVLDGLGGLPHPETGQSELQTARTPNLDELACRSECGLLDPVYPGVTPGSGPGHLALFGYDPLRHPVGRGIVSALGLDFELLPGDIAGRCNFATVDAQGLIINRNAGRIPTSECRRLCETISESNPPDDEVQLFLVPEISHRALLVLRGKGLGLVTDTDPIREGMRPLEPKPAEPGGETTARILSRFLSRAHELLRDEKRANAVLTRGFDRFRNLPSMTDLYGLKPLALARYPDYQGVARLVGMKVQPTPESYEEQLEAMRARWREHDFFFFHTKETDEHGEDGDFDAKVAAIENVDTMLPRILDLGPDVLAVTGDHSTPAVLGAHSWHPVPALLHSRYSRSGATNRFDENACAAGALGRLPMNTLLPQMLAHGLRLKRWGA